MRPTLIRIGTLKFHSYPTMLAIAFIVCTLWAVRDANRAERRIPATTQGGLWGFIGGLIGAKVFWILQYSEWKYLWRAVFVWEGGLVFYGGLIGGILGVALYLRVNKFPYWQSADIAAPYVALGEAITRVGCFLNGCCWGAVAPNLPWAVVFPRHSPAFLRQVQEGLLERSAQASLPVHPTQLYMVAGLLVIAFLLKMGHSGKRPFDGAIGLGYCFLYGILRFSVEALRGDNARSVSGMTVSQSISLGLVVGAAATYIIVVHRQRQTRPAVVEEELPVHPEGDAEACAASADHELSVSDSEVERNS